MEDLIIKTASNVIVLLIVALVTISGKWLAEMAGTERIKKLQSQMELKQGLAYTAVKFVEQAWKDLSGEHKYDQAAAWLTEQASALGLKLTPEEARGLIEAALREIKDQLGEEWARAVD